MALKQVVLILGALASLVACQRPFFAGSRPIGYPEITTQPPNTTDELGNRFGESDSNVTTTTQRLPIEANGDKDLIDRLSKLPIDNQPFWFINWQALEANRQKPQTYPVRPSSFAQPAVPVNTGGSQELVNRFSGDTTSVVPPVVPANSVGTGNQELGNRFSEDTSSFVQSVPPANKTGNQELVNRFSGNTGSHIQPAAVPTKTVGNKEIGNRFSGDTSYVPRPVYPAYNAGNQVLANKFSADTFRNTARPITHTRPGSNDHYKIYRQQPIAYPGLYSE